MPNMEDIDLALMLDPAEAPKNDTEPVECCDKPDIVHEDDVEEFQELY